MPVRFILDGFATNVYIPGFDKILLVIRSREICASVIDQSVAQLEALYGAARAEVIIDNCDNCLYLGRQDVTTARYISVRANRTVVFILNLPLGEACLFTRGQPPETVLRWAFELASPRPLTAEPAAAPLQLRGGTALLHLKKPLPSGDFPYRSLQRAGAFSSIYGGIYRRRRAENARWRKSKYTRSPPEFSLHISSVQYFYKPAGKTIAAKQEGGAAA